MFLFLHNTGIFVFWPGILTLGFIIGLLSGTFGVGGGFLLTPLLRYIFGVPFEYAIGSSLCAIAISSISGAVIHYRRGNISLRLGLLLLCGSLPGVELGTRLLKTFKSACLQQSSFITNHTFDTVISCCYLLLLLFSTWLMLKDALKFRNNNPGKSVIRDMSTYKIIFFFKSAAFCYRDSKKNTDYINGSFIIIFGLLIGILSGFLGIGGGILVAPVLISIAGLPSVLVIGTSLFQLTITAGAGALMHALRGNLEPVLIGLIVFTSVFGSVLGSRLTSKIRGVKIRILYAGFLILSSIFIIIEIALLK